MARRLGHAQHERKGTVATPVGGSDVVDRGSAALVGLPEMTPVEGFNVRPGGNGGLTAYRSIGPDTAGINSIASPTTAGKGSDPLYENAGSDGVVKSPPQPASHDRPRSTPTTRMGIVPLPRIADAL